jgi:hypothetical protein
MSALTGAMQRCAFCLASSADAVIDARLERVFVAHRPGVHEAG